MMIIPIQASPTLRNVSKAKLFQTKGIDPSALDNPSLQCDLCCQAGAGDMCSAIPGCIC
ncbi:MAG: hypothetical protein F6K56_37920 [Moorea sp. SIO3G5]|nr:hypothetical protein [Moorena sp. SIO3G5]